jgi:hypothetical protein
MNMVLPAIGDPLALSTMLGFSDLDRDQWDPQDLKAMLRHQLAAPLYLGLGTLSAEVSQELRSSFPDQPRMTLGELFALEHPPLNVLMLVKQFAKMCRSDRTNPLPPEIAMLMYYASIAVAMVRLDQSISHLAPESVRRSLNWLNRQRWIPEELKPLLVTGLERVKLPFSQTEEPGTG